MSRPALLLVAALALASTPAAAQGTDARQQADACRKEAERFAATFTAPGAESAPGARAGTTLTEEDRRQMRRRLDEARAAATRGDAEECLRTLREVRTTARQAGFGGAGGSTMSGNSGRGAGGGSGSGSLNTNTAGSRPPGAPGAAGSTAGSMGGGTSGGAGSGGASGGSGGGSQ